MNKSGSLHITVPWHVRLTCLDSCLSPQPTNSYNISGISSLSMAFPRHQGNLRNTDPKNRLPKAHLDNFPSTPGNVINALAFNNFFPPTPRILFISQGVACLDFTIPQQTGSMTCSDKTQVSKGSNCRQIQDENKPPTATPTLGTSEFTHPFLCYP